MIDVNVPMMTSLLKGEWEWESRLVFKRYGVYELEATLNLLSEELRKESDDHCVERP